MKNYLNLIHKIILEGEDSNDRTGVGTKSIFGTRMEWDLKKGFPAVTCKTLAWKSVVSELLWFLSGSSNLEHLRTRLHGYGSDKSTIWDANYKNQGRALGYTKGNLGPIYGHQWRNFNGIDQIKNLLMSIRMGNATGVHSRRNIVTAWNVPDIPHMTLPPCHHTFQVHVNKNKELSLMWHQRSVDVFLGLPFNIASYALLTHILAEITGCTVGNLIFTGGDTHIYKNHMVSIAELMERSPGLLPELVIPNLTDLDSVLQSPIENFKLNNYNPQGKIVAPMAI